jgi:hypothetical protein
LIFKGEIYCLVQNEDLDYEWIYVFTPILKIMESEVKKIDIFSLNLYKYFTMHYDEEKKIAIFSFLNKYVFISKFRLIFFILFFNKIKNNIKKVKIKKRIKIIFLKLIILNMKIFK